MNEDFSHARNLSRESRSPLDPLQGDAFNKGYIYIREVIPPVRSGNMEKARERAKYLAPKVDAGVVMSKAEHC